MIAKTIEKHIKTRGRRIATISKASYNKRHDNLSDLIEITAWATGQEPEAIAGTDSYMPLVKARSIVAKIARKSYTLQEIGRALNRYHKTIINLLNSYDEFLSIDPDFQKTYKRVLYNL